MASNLARFIELQALVAKLAPDFEKFYAHHNGAAGTRIRTGMQDVKKLAQAIRAEVLELKKA